MLNPRLLIALTLALSIPAAAQPVSESYSPKDWKLPEADAQKWAERLKKLCRGWDWTVTVKGNDIIMQRNKPVRFTNQIFNAPPTGAPAKGPSFEGTYRLTLRFGPEMSSDKYEALSAANFETEKQDGLLQRKHGLSSRFGELLSYGSPDKEKERKAAYNEDAKKLVFHELPDFYAPNFSITLYQSWRWFQYLDSGNKEVDEECNDVRSYLVKYFGGYNYLAAIGNSSFGREEPVMEK